MFDGLTSRLSGILDRLKGRGALSESDVNEAMREVRRALLEADVALDVVRAFTERAGQRALGAEVLRSITPGQMVVKIVHDELIATLGGDGETINLDATPPIAIMMVGLQGSGKTTTTAKLAKRLSERHKKKVLMASLDVRRPAAQEQLRILGEQTAIDTLPIIAGQLPVKIAERALIAARLGGYDVVMLDTAGRTTLDEEMMREAADVARTASPHEILLVADSLTGQDAVNTARAFAGRVDLTGIVLTRADGDGRGGAALSMRAVTGKPIKYLGIGEKLDELEDFHPSRVANRILGMGDIVGLVEKAAENIDAEKAIAIAKRMQQGQFSLDDLAEQLRQMLRIGGLSGVLGMLPGVGKIKNQLSSAQLDDKVLKRQIAVITSMTKEERNRPDKVLNFSRKKRIAKGSGTTLEDINKVLKMHRGMADMMKQMGKQGRGGGLGSALGGLFGMGGSAPPMPNSALPNSALPSPEEIAAFEKQTKASLPKGLGTPPTNLGKPGLPGLPGLGKSGLPGLGLPGLGLPGLGGFPTFPKKK